MPITKAQLTKLIAEHGLAVEAIEARPGESMVTLRVHLDMHGDDQPAAIQELGVRLREAGHALCRHGLALLKETPQ